MRVIILILLIPITLFFQTQTKFTIDLIHLQDTSVVVIENNPFMPYPTSTYKNSIRIGVLRNVGIEYKLVVFQLEKENYSKYSFLWLDKLNNNKFDYVEDHLDQMYVPFTLNGATYRITSIDTLGKNIELLKYEGKEFPPIEIGQIAPDISKKTAPDISKKTVDDKRFELTEVKEKYKVLYFWGCMYPLHFREFNTVQQHFINNKDIRFICLSTNDEYLKTKPINWIHIGLEGFEDPMRIKYQVGSLPQMFVLDAKNTIRYILKEVQSKYLIEAIEKVIQ
ncbi:MAG: hypothetical protein FD143_3062 [Ignavibacteria bacterium]|nr:MAG: hypothetical protein FD143_3062 [Ignavibacteria bacterium]KAF0154718.1 MAG: hypothetical protein FD188_3236 [Ignavibacteria bacterium]